MDRWRLGDGRRKQGKRTVTSAGPRGSEREEEGGGERRGNGEGERGVCV
jgi:hypothetical protein